MKLKGSFWYGHFRWDITIFVQFFNEDVFFSFLFFLRGQIMLIFLSALPMSYLAHAHAWIILSSMLWFLVFLQPTTQCVLHYLLCACSTEDTCLLLLPAREPSPLGAQDVEAHALLSSGVPGSNCHWWPRWLPLHFVQSKLRSPRH